MTEGIKILLRRLECISRDLKVFSTYFGENRLWVPLPAKWTVNKSAGKTLDDRFASYENIAWI